MKKKQTQRIRTKTKGGKPEADSTKPVNTGKPQASGTVQRPVKAGAPADKDPRPSRLKAPETGSRKAAKPGSTSARPASARPTSAKSRKPLTAKSPAAGKRPGSKAKLPTGPTQPSGENDGGERINRFLARCGLCSRREADRWVEAGRVTVNNQVSQEPGLKIKPGDIVCVDGKPVEVQTLYTYILYNKPMGQLCTRRDDNGRALIYDSLDVAPNVQSIGRLDMDTEGLLLLTDDGALTRALTHPGAKMPREYRVRVGGQVSLETLEKLRRGGFEIGEGDTSDGWEVSVDSETKGHTWLTVVIFRGRWREVRRTLEAVGHPVRRLMRTRFGPIRLEEGMPRGSYRKLNRSEVKKLLDQVTTEN